MMEEDRNIIPKYEEWIDKERLKVLRFKKLYKAYVLMMGSWG